MEATQESVSELLERLGKQLDTHTVFGEPQMVDGSAIIPVAKISYGGGGGGGTGMAPEGAEETGEHAAQQAHGEGSGMGFGVTAKPLGVIEVRHEAVRWVPIVDASRLAAIWSVIAGLLLLTLFGGLRRR